MEYISKMVYTKRKNGRNFIMTVHAEALLLWLYEDHVNGVYPQRVDEVELAMNRKEHIRAGKELKANGFLPDFDVVKNTKNGESIIFYGRLSDDAIKYARKFDED